MATETAEQNEEIPSWVLAFGPFFVIGFFIAVAFATISIVDVQSLEVTGTVEILGLLTVIGFVAGVVPVGVGMLWFPYIRRLSTEWVHAVLAFSAGILAFIAIEMAAGAISFSADVSTPFLGESVALVTAGTTVLVMELVDRWRKQKTTAVHGDGLRIAYLVAIGLGLHSVGEGLAIGTAFVTDQIGLVVLLTVGFIMHNVTEGPAVIAAIASEEATPALRHFGALGMLAGGGVIVGGWIGSLVSAPLVGAVFFAIAFGAIAQVIWEMMGLVRTNAGTLLTPRLIAAFVLGGAVLFFLEEIVVDAWLLG